MISSIHQLPRDTLCYVLSNLSLSEICLSATVCGEWYLAHSKDITWNPLAEVLKPLACRCMHSEGNTTSSKELVLKRLQLGKFLADDIMKFIVDENAMKTILNHPPFTFEDFSEMPRFERSFQIFKGVGNDSTPLLQSLIHKIKDRALENCHQGRFFMDANGVVHDSEEYNIVNCREKELLFVFIKKPLGPFDSKAVALNLQYNDHAPAPSLQKIFYLAYSHLFESQQDDHQV